MVNLSQADLLDRAVSLSVDGIGLLRSELMMMELLDQRHPHWWIQKGRQDELSDRLSTQISKFARAFAPRPVFYRSLDLRSHEFRALDGSDMPIEMNPMLGVRGTFRSRSRSGLNGSHL
jgi:pyruvate,water dikinase